MYKKSKRNICKKSRRKKSKTKSRRKHKKEYKNSITFNYTRNIQEFIPTTNEIHVIAFGARGSYGNLGGGIPGKGGMVSANLKVKKGVPLYINVGGISNTSVGCDIKLGGQATDIRLNKDDIYSRILVAGGGGSVGGYNGQPYGDDPHPIGGSGGGIKGENSSGGGGAKNKGGIAHKYSKFCIGNNGIFGYGGIGNNICGCNGSGGDSWYGGASGTNEGGGGGGSNYITPHGSSNVIHKRGVNNGDGFLIVYF